ncbi:thiamine pyrophosphate-requiring protein, partial [Pseudoduganella sp. RAF53_2]
FPYAKYAEMLGLRGLRVDRPEDIASAWDQALSSDVPTLVEMVTDPNVPPLPPHVSAKQTMAYVRAMLGGDKDAMAVISASAKEIWEGLFPPGGKSS